MGFSTTVLTEMSAVMNSTYGDIINVTVSYRFCTNSLMTGLDLL